MTAKQPARLHRMLLATAVAMVVTVGGVVIQDWTSNTPDQIAQTVPKQPAKPQILRQTDLQKAVAALGPFQTLAVPSSDHPDTNNPAVLLLRQDGSVAASQKWTLTFTHATWAALETMQISRVQVNGDYAVIEDSTGNVYTVRCGQPFVMEGVPQQLLLVDTAGQQWTAPTTRANILRRSL